MATEPENYESGSDPVIFTDAAANKVDSLIREEANPNLKLRVFIAGGGGVSSSLFTANMAIRLPAEVAIDDIANELESLSEDTRVMLDS